VFVVLCALLVGEVLGEAALGNYYKDVVREQHELINEMNQNFTELEKASEKLIDLGLYVGKHKLPPKTIKITKTVAVKVPVPFPVKVPEPVPVPVPVSKPVPVPVPTLVAIPVESTAATAAAATVTGGGGSSTGGPTPSSPVPADADPASSQAHPSTVQLQDWKNISSTSTTIATNSTTTTTTSTPPASIRNSRSIINVITNQRKRDRTRARNSTTGDTGAAPAGPAGDKDSTMSVVLKFKPVRIRLQSSDLSLMRTNRRPNRMTSGATSSANSTRPRTPVPRIRPIPLRQATPEANLHRLRHRASVKATTTPASTSSSSSSSSSSSEETTENRSSSLSNSVEQEEEEEEPQTEEDASVEQRSEELEESVERELVRKPARTRTSSSAKVRDSKRTTKRPRYRDSKRKAKRHSKRHSKRDSKRGSKRDSKRHSKRDSKRHAKRNSKRSKPPKKVRTVQELVVKPKKSTTSRHVHSNSLETRTRGMRSPISHATTPISVLASSSTVTTKPTVYRKAVAAEETAPAASSPKATITRLSPSRTDLLQQQQQLGEPFQPPKHTVTRYRGNGPRRYPPRATIIRIHIQRTYRGKHIKVFVIKPSTPEPILFPSTTPPNTIPILFGQASNRITQTLHPADHPSSYSSTSANTRTYDAHAEREHQQHDQFGQKHTASYGSSAKPTVYSVPSDAHLYPDYNAAADHDNHGTGHDNHGPGTSGKFHYHFHNVHPVGGGGDHQQSAASEHQYRAVHAGHAGQYGGAAGPDGSLVTSYDPPASGNTYHFHDDGTDDMFAGASDVQEQLRAPYGHAQ
uniref:Uncharacterized protein n=1 Tax=Anopheles dirus TaxID=7168 RepID=A0A182NGN1_9DIPT